MSNVAEISYSQHMENNMQILVEAQVLQRPGVNESCWEDVDVEQVVVVARGFLIPLFLRFGRDGWVSERYLNPLLLWPWVGWGIDIVLRFSSGVWWYDP